MKTKVFLASMVIVCHAAAAVIAYKAVTKKEQPQPKPVVEELSQAVKESEEEAKRQARVNAREEKIAQCVMTKSHYQNHDQIMVFLQAQKDCKKQVYRAEIFN